jgi:hypothetical protein
MDLKNDKRQHIQLELDFSFTRSGEACGTGREETESRLAAHDCHPRFKVTAIPPAM